MILKGRQVDGFVAAPDPSLRTVLIYGPDAGLVAERAASLGRAVVPDLSDPFRVTNLSGAELGQDPARLQDEAQAMALTGGARLVLVRDAKDELTPVFEGLLGLEGQEAWVVIEAGDLGARSSLRKLCESAKNAAVIACYADDVETIAEIAARTLKEAGLHIEPAALRLLTERLGADRMISRRALEKLILYMGPGARSVSVSDVEACIGDGGAAVAYDDIVYAAAAGNARALDAALQRGFTEGLTPVGVIRMTAIHLQKLQAVIGEIGQGGDPGRAMKSLRPPIFFKRQDAFRAQLRQWDGKRLGAALGLLTEAEMRCKMTGMPEHAVCARALFGIAAAARPPAKRRR